MNRLSRLAIVTLAINIVVILLGAAVRATGSGAGCGRSWPTCNGVLVPELEGATAIEFSHRAASGVALIFVFALVWLIFRRTQAGHPARLGAVISGIAIVIEALIGAVIVLAEWVANDASVARAVSVPIHLVSTFVLLGGLVLTVFWLAGGGPIHWREARGPKRAWLAIALGMLAIGATGSVTALADTLFPKPGFDLATMFVPPDTGHFLTQLRVAHPIVAAIVGAGAAAWSWRRLDALNGGAYKAACIVIGLVVLEFALGATNIMLGTPLALSLTHLALADGLWMAWVWLGASLFQVSATRA